MKTYLAESWDVDAFENLERAPLSTDSGRGPIKLIHHPKSLIVERRYLHGGLHRFFFPDLFFVTRRAQREYQIHRKLFNAGLATVEPVGWAEQPSVLPGFRRYSYYSRFLPDAKTLAVWLAEDGLDGNQLCQMAAILHQLFQDGVQHADLNLNNWLVAAGKIYIIDFDKAHATRLEPEVYLAACLKRMARSAKKLGLFDGSSIPLRFLILCAGRFDLDPQKVLVRFSSQIFQERFWDRCRWRISGGHRKKSPIRSVTHKRGSNG